MQFNLMIAGVGGQGTVLASKLIAAAAMKKGFNARTTETIGMAQRGGCVFGHVRIGERVFSPLIPQGKADALIAFEPAEAVRQLSYLRKDGVVVVCDNPVKPVTLSMSGNYEAAAMMDYLKTNTARVISVDIKKLLDNKQIASGGGTKALNVFILGAAAQSGIFPFDAEIFKDVLKEVLPDRILDMNLQVFELGRQL
ncbi:MAG: indolepyruvate oxidoreductase subunit beta [Treponema sp.]|nr:indolepyruvate oxidoreductase subunit beta [Treponema sp.]